jgi:hypothetical protein
MVPTPTFQVDFLLLIFRGIVFWHCPELTQLLSSALIFRSRQSFTQRVANRSPRDCDR